MKLPLWVRLQQLNSKSNNNDNKKSGGLSCITSPNKHNATVKLQFVV